MNNKKEIILGTTLMVAGAGLMVAQLLILRKEDAMRKQRVADTAATMEKLNEHLEAALGRLTKKVEDAKKTANIDTD